MGYSFANIRSGRPGEMYAIVGNMGSGKTTRLIGLASDPTNQGHGVLFFEPRFGKRTDNVSLQGRTMATYPETIPVASIADMAKAINQSSAMNIVMDEIQFLMKMEHGEEEGYALARAIVRSGRDFYFSGLTRDFKGDPWELVARLVMIADHREFLTTRCKKCGAPGADLPQRLEYGQPVPANHPRFWADTPGSIESGITYEARCTMCHVVPDDWNEHSKAIHRAIEQAKAANVPSST